ncbi:MAG: hypothetical protein HPY79_05340 [Bacteroidales bacterium]|nr:hypothetical protein [Bacteroidales bacterium]
MSSFKIKEFYPSLSREKVKDTGIIVAIFLILWGYWSNNDYIYIYIIPILLITILIPNLFYPIAFLIFGFANIIGKITQLIIFSILYFFLITPISLFRKALKKDSLKIYGFKKTNNTAFIDREHEYTYLDLENPY